MNIYIYTPQGFETGGIELLHQLCHELNNHEDINAYIWYSDPNKAYIPSVYAEYGNEFRVTDLPPKGSVLIFPEAWARELNEKKYKDYVKVLYWESVYWYEYWIPKNLYMKFPEGTIHIVQSWYAYWWLQGKYIESIYVTDYLNDEYMNADLSKPRKRQIVYNPKKGLEITKRIMAELPNEKFIPIENMTVAEIKSLMEESMLYIDFGNHPGKDRIPREAAMCGCCVITNREGSAAYYEDVAIPNEYRIDMTCENSLDEAVRMIEYCLNHYDDSLLSADFMEYRFRIIDEKVDFKEGVRKLINRLWEVSE